MAWPVCSGQASLQYSGQSAEVARGDIGTGVHCQTGWPKMAECYAVLTVCGVLLAKVTVLASWCLCDGVIMMLFSFDIDTDTEGDDAV